MTRKILLAICCLFSFSSVAKEAKEAVENTIELAPMTVTTRALTAPPINTEADSKTEFYREELTERGLNRLQDLSKNTPNFSITNVGSGSFAQIINLRSLTNTGIFSPPSVVFYVDDVAYSSPMSNAGWLFDMEEVSIYRDPQPARFGKNAYAGAVDMHTRQATNELHGNIGFGVASYNNYRVNVKSSGALIKDTLFFNLSGLYQTSDGFLINDFLHNHPSAEENFSGQASLTWKPNAAWDIRLSLSKESFDYGNRRWVKTDSTEHSFTTSSGLAEKNKQASDTQALRIAYESDNYKLLSVTSHRFWKLSPLLVDLFLTPAGNNTLEHNFSDETWSQEFRLNPKTHGDWDWQLGSFYSTTDFRGTSDLRIPVSKTLNYWATQRSTDNYALLGHLAYQGFHDLTLYTDVRVDYFHSQLNGTLSTLTGSYLENRHYDTVFASPKWGVDYRFSDNALLYASTGFGAKPGGLTHASSDNRFVDFKQENLWHNTVGIKTDGFNQRLTSNLSAFYYRMKNYQIERDLANGNYETFNAPRVSSYGFELENRAQLLEHLYLENSVGYTHSRLDNYHDLITGADYRGERVPFIPDFNALTALQYKDAQGYFARAEWVWKGKTCFNETQCAVASQQDYSLLNLRIGYNKNGYSAYLYADNATDTYYYTIRTATRGAPGNPRVIGAQLGVDF
jgi:iron complex outermembrane receptor protein